jgi:phosphoribosyl-AMP cyclohydrolase
MNDPLADPLRFGADGLVPVVVQDAVTGDVLMLASMNEEALRLTYATGEAHYWSRSRQKLWRKGESSGHTQAVEDIRINCERNSLLLLVRQTGAVCHDGYATCYYRRLSEDCSLTVLRERAFDPATVYDIPDPQPAGETSSEIDRLAEATRRQFGAYAFLRDNDLTAESATSRRLRAHESGIGGRVGDELRELAGVLEGSHRHGEFLSDLRLEASQVIYWVLVQVLRQGVTWARLRPDRALTTEDIHPERGTIAQLLRAEADCWALGVEDDDPAARAHATLALVALACHSGGLDPLAAVESDLEELQTRPYLARYFGHEDRTHDPDPERERTSAN